MHGIPQKINLQCTIILVKLVYTRGEYAGNYDKLLLRSSETTRETSIYLEWRHSPVK